MDKTATIPPTITLEQQEDLKTMIFEKIIQHFYRNSNGTMTATAAAENIVDEWVCKNDIFVSIKIN